MATASDTAIGTLDQYLERICEEIQLGDTQFETAVDRYTSIGEWLIERDSPMDRLSPEVFPQGSMLQRTTTRPLRRGKDVVPFDVDAVCCCDVDPAATSSQSIYASIRRRLEAQGTYAQLLKNAEDEFPPSGKCLRLAYRDEDFYLDVVPMCKDPSDDEGVRLLMAAPSRWNNHSKPIETWKRTDPLRFAGWIDAMARKRKGVLEERIACSVKPIPPREEAIIKAPLRRVIQLLKRYRDVNFLGDEKRPTSILLSTLAGRHYDGDTSIASALTFILAAIEDDIDAAEHGRLVVLSPTDEIAPHDGPPEDLAAPMDDECYSKFCSMISDMRTAISRLRATRGIPAVFASLTETFAPHRDTIVRRAMQSVDADIQKASAEGSIGAAASGSGIHVVTDSKTSERVRRVPSNTFHKDK